MKTAFPCFISIIMIFLSCHKTTVAPNENFSVLHERFHGKYKIISSESSEAIDINLDGIASNNMLSEIPDLAQAHLEILIRENEPFLFTQFWQEQYFGYGEPVNYDSSLVINYAKQGATRQFTFDADVTHLNLYPDTTPLPDSLHFPFPKSVTIKANDRIEVIETKKIFTRAGWKKVEIITLYERFTTVT